MVPRRGAPEPIYSPLLRLDVLVKRSWKAGERGEEKKGVQPVNKRGGWREKEKF
jgi:hypothetical protein